MLGADVCCFLGLGTLLLYLDISEIEISIALSKYIGKHIGTPLSVQFQMKCTKEDEPLETAFSC